MQKRHFFLSVPGNDKPWISLWCRLIWGARKSLKIVNRSSDCLDFDEILQKKKRMKTYRNSFSGFEPARSQRNFFLPQNHQLAYFASQSK
jgi:hypothetical protein